MQSSYFSFEENTSLTYTNYNWKGKVESKQTNTVKDVEQMSDGTVKATLAVKVEDKKGKETAEMSYEVYCKHNTLEMDFSSMITPEMQASFENMEVTMSGDNFQLPSNLKVGMELPNIEVEIAAAMNGFNVMTMRVSQTNRKVEAKETITTDAGTFECFKLSYDSNLKTIMTMKQHVITWYNEEVGLVKQELYNKKGKLQSRQELAAVVKSR